MNEPEPRPGIHDLLAESSWVRSVAHRLVRDASLADDLVQEAYLRALESPPRDRLAIRAWFRTVLRRLAYGSFRDRQRQQEKQREACQPETPESVEDLVERVEDQRRVAGIVTDLEEPYREVVLLRYFSDLSSQQIAERLGIPASTARVRLKRGLEKVRDKLDREYGDRQAWCLALLPLAKLAPLTPTAGVSAVSKTAIPKATGTTLGGGLIMFGVFKWSVPVIVLAVAGWWAYDAGQVPTPDAREIAGSGDSRSMNETPFERPVDAETSPVESVDPSTSTPQQRTGSESGTAAAVPSLRVTGSVRSSTGKGLARAQVLLRIGSPNGLHMRRALGATNGQGRFDLAIPDIGFKAKRALILEADGHQPKELDLDAGTEKELCDLGDIMLFAERTLTGRVEGEDGKPIVGASVTLVRAELQTSDDGSPTMMGIQSEPVTTDRQGAFTFSTYDGGTEYRVTCRASGWVGPVIQRWSPDPEESLSLDPIILVLSPAQSIEGFVHFSDGSPAEGASVRIGQGIEAGRTETLSDGSFRFDEEPPGRVWTVQVDHPSAISFFQPEMPANSVLNIELERAGIARVQLVVDAILSTVVVRWRRANGDVTQHEHSAQENVVTLTQLAPGPAELQVSVDGRISEWRSMVVDPGRVVELELELFPVEPFVVEVVDRDGQPIGSAVVTAFGRGLWGSGQEVDGLGRASSTNWIRDQIGIMVEAPGFTPRIDSDVGGVAGAVHTVTLDLASVLTVHVVGSGSRDPELRLGITSHDSNIRTWLERSRFPIWKTRGGDSQLTDIAVEAGFLRVEGLPPGDYVLTLRTEEYERYRWEQSVNGTTEATVTVEEEQRLDVAGSVFFNDVPAVKGRLSLYRPTPAFRTEIPLDADGQFQANLPAGFYWISYVDQNSDNTLYGFSLRRSIDSPVLELKFRAVEAEVQFVDADGRPVRIQGGSLYNVDCGRFLFDTDEHGVVRFSKIAPGRYTLFSTSSGQLVIPESPTEPVRVEVRPKGSR